MKLSIIRYSKLIFVYLRLHVLFNPFASLFLNLYYLTKFSAWTSQNRKKGIANDFPSKWNYFKRFELYKKIVATEKLDSTPINYLEFGVADGYSFHWFMKEMQHPESRFNGFDTFTGLPED